MEGNAEHLRTWGIRTESLDIGSIKYFESVMTQGNGYLGTRGSFEDPLPGSDAPLTLIAGIYDKPDAEYLTSRLAPAPNWLPLRFFDGADWFSMTTGEIISITRSLSFRNGVLTREVRWKGPSGRVTKLIFRRFVSMARPNLCAIMLSIIPENYSGKGKVRSELDCGSWYPDGIQQTDIVSRSQTGDILSVAVKTRDEGHTIAEAARTRAYKYGHLKPRCISPERSEVPSETSVAEEFDLDLEQGRRSIVEKLVIINDSMRSDDPLAKSIEQVRDLPRYVVLEKEQKTTWDNYWRQVDIRIDGDGFAQSSVRFFIFHLLQSACRNNVSLNLDVSIPAKCLSGPGYSGHIFWDTEVYMLPFYSLQFPDAAEQLMRYRFDRLPQARANALEEGRKGARFPWESASTGVEVCPRWIPFRGKMLRIWMADNELHVIADIAYGAWQHYVSTGDEHYLSKIAMPIIIETARYWPERAERNDLADGAYQYVINDVTPPNEWHEHVNNSFFTNTMARWNIRKALELLSDSEYAERAYELVRELGITDEELSKWRDVSDNIKIPYNLERDLYEESDGFLSLEVPNDIFAVQYEDYEKSQIIKLADTLLALHLLPGLVDTESFRRHYDYYVPLTTHRSSLSPAMHVLFSLEVGYRGRAYDFLVQAFSIDGIKRGTETDPGLHAASLGGGWQAVVFGFGGLRVSEDGLELDPDLPDKWRRLHFNIIFRGARISFNITSGRIRVMVSSSAPGPVTLRVQGREVVALPGKPADIRTITRKRKHWSRSRKQQ